MSRKAALNGKHTEHTGRRNTPSGFITVLSSKNKNNNYFLYQADVLFFIDKISLGGPCGKTPPKITLVLWTRERKKWKMTEREMARFSLSQLSRFMPSDCSWISSSLDIWSWFSFSPGVYHRQTIRSLFLSLFFNMTCKHQKECLVCQTRLSLVLKCTHTYCLKLVVGQSCLKCCLYLWFLMTCRMHYIRDEFTLQTSTTWH